LLRNGIEVTRLRQPFLLAQRPRLLAGAHRGRRARSRGSYVIDLNQPQRRLAKGCSSRRQAWSAPSSSARSASSSANRRRGEDADKEDYGFYDITAWSLPLSFNLDAYWTETPARPVGSGRLDVASAAGADPRGERVRLLERPAGGGAARLALEAENFKLAVARQSLRVGGRTYPRGTSSRARNAMRPACTSELPRWGRLSACPFSRCRPRFPTPATPGSARKMFLPSTRPPFSWGGRWDLGDELRLAVALPDARAQRPLHARGVARAERRH